MADQGGKTVFCLMIGLKKRSFSGKIPRKIFHHDIPWTFIKFIVDFTEI